MKFWDKFKRAARRKLVIHVVDRETLADRGVYRMRQSTIWITMLFGIILIMGVTTLLFFTTGLKDYLPGYTSAEFKQEKTEMAKRLRAMQERLAAQESYIQSIRTTAGFEESDSLLKSKTAGELAQSAQKAQVRPSQRPKPQEPAADAAGAEPSVPVQEAVLRPEPALLFANPVRGEVTKTFAPDNGHYAIDLAVPKDEIVKAAARGRVIIAGFTLETGHVIAIAHPGNYISVYKHNSRLMKNVGSYVYKGEPIAISGNSGENTTGPHLHFEIWMDGQAIDPLTVVDYSK